MNLKIKNILSKKNKTKIICLTSYSKNISEILDKHIDITLVGDSLGSVLYSYKTTKKVKLEMMIEHSKSVRQGVRKSLLVVDMPYNTYRNKMEALLNTKKVLKNTKADAIKLEGGKKILEIIKHLRKNNINVMGHLGILPQSQRGKFRYKGKTSLERKNLLRDAVLLQKSGVFSIVLECVETKLAKEITSKLKIPTIGIGSSVNCDGQVLVTDDLIGLNLTPIKFVKNYSNIRKYIDLAVKNFCKEVKNKKFPSKKFSY
tara:strand:+ start:1579 stop:2355 length:777 start_codon:yes stop_codon:yes gene_type:complete